MARAAAPETVTRAVGGPDPIAVALARSGAGPPIVLIHGLGGPDMWERVVPLLSPDHDVIVAHLPGFGESPPAAGGSSAEAHASLLALLLDELDVRDVTVVGISYGGEIAALLASGRPGRVSSLVLVCPTGVRRFPFWLRSAFIRAVLRPFLKAAAQRQPVAERFSRKSFHDLSARPAGLVRRYVERLRRPGRVAALIAALEDLWRRGGTLPALAASLAQLRVTLIWGENDRLVDPESSRIIRESLPGVRSVSIPACGHSVPLERPEALAAEIRAARGGAATPYRP